MTLTSSSCRRSMIVIRTTLLVSTKGNSGSLLVTRRCALSVARSFRHGLTTVAVVERRSQASSSPASTPSPRARPSTPITDRCGRVRAERRPGGEEPTSLHLELAPVGGFGGAMLFKYRASICAALRAARMSQELRAMYISLRSITGALTLSVGARGSGRCALCNVTSGTGADP